jgi:hypothetical protein
MQCSLAFGSIGARTKLVGMASAAEPIRDGRIHIEKINGPSSFEHDGMPNTAGG